MGPVAVAEAEPVPLALAPPAAVALAPDWAPIGAVPEETAGNSEVVKPETGDTPGEFAVAGDGKEGSGVVVPGGSVGNGVVFEGGVEVGGVVDGNVVLGKVGAV